MAAPKTSNGTTISFSSSIFAKVIDFSWGGIEVAVMPAGTMDDTAGIAKLFGASYDPGRITLTCLFNDEAAYITALTSAVSSCTVAWAGGTTSWGNTASGTTGFKLVSLQVNGGYNELLTLDATVECSGTITADVTP